MKNKVNILFIGSILVFITASCLHLYNKKTLAYAVGSGGGRMSSVILMVSPSGVCGPCPVCGSYSVALAPSSGLVNTLCAPAVNKPNGGLPITQASVGQKILGNWTATFPTAISTNWGTALQ